VSPDPTAAERPLSLTLDVSAIPARAAGAGQYVLALARALAAEPSVAPTLVSRRSDAARWRHPGQDGTRPEEEASWADAAGRGRAGGVTAPLEVAAIAPDTRPTRLAWEQLVLPRWLSRRSPAVHHGPHYTMPERSSVPSVVTVHDCTFFDHPEWHQRSKVLVFRRAIRVAARRAAAIICVSQATAEQLSSVCEVRAPVFVAPHGVDHERFVPREVRPGADDEVLEPLGIDRHWPFVLFVGTIEPRKGVSTLVRAFGALSRRHRDLRLVIAGQPGWGTSEVERAIATVAGGERILRLGYVADGAVPALLRRAVVAAYPSLAEGYGLPAIEALACGTPLVTTTGTAMAELAGSAAVLVSPGDAGGLADAIDEVLGEGAERAEARRDAGLTTASAYTWSASLARHLDAYRFAAGLPAGAVG